MRFLSGIESLHPYKGLSSAKSLKAAILAASPDLIVPCDDGVVWQLHEIHANNPEFRPLIERSLGAKEAYPTLQRRGEVLRTAKDLHIRVPLTQTVKSTDDLKGWCTSTPAVLKLDGTWGGEGVIIARTPDKAIAAFHRLSKPFSAYLAWKRFLINHDPLALWSWRRQTKSSVTVQEFIQGRPANTMFACWNGEVLAIVTVEVLASQGATGAATVVRLVRNEEIERAARLLASKFKLSGFHGLDFILEDRSGDAYLIELNPRCTQLGHLDLRGAGDLAGALCAKLLGLPTEEPIPDAWHKQLAVESTVAFFPQALNWNPKSEYLSRGFHDVPWEEPTLVRELLRRPWPERQLLSRVYHYFRVPQRVGEVKFSEESSERLHGQKYPLPISEDNIGAAKAVEKTTVNT